MNYINFMYVHVYMYCMYKSYFALFLGHKNKDKTSHQEAVAKYYSNANIVSIQVSLLCISLESHCSNTH